MAGVGARSPIDRMQNEKGWLAQVLIDTVKEIAAISDFRPPVKKLYCNLARRLMLLKPMFEEIKESTSAVPVDSMNALMALRDALNYAIEILKFGSHGSKIYLVLEREKILTDFHEVTAKLEKLLSEISYEKLDISDEVKEQVDLVRSQFKRAKGTVDSLDDELYDDVLFVYNKKSDDAIDASVLRRVTENLQLLGIEELTQESLALHEMVISSDGDPGASIEKMSNLLKKIKDFVQTEHPIIDDIPKGNGSGPRVVNAKSKPPEIPDDFRCPISLELMTDPVIVSTGQTYERKCIEKWLESGQGTCPKTQQPLANTTLTPNYALRSLIAQWCEANDIEPPRRPGIPPPSKTFASTHAERTKIDSLLLKLTSRNSEDQLSAAGEIRLLAKRKADNRIAIAEAGAIPLLVDLLAVPDSRIQEHAVTALLNLSICEINKGCIVSAGAIPGIVHMLKKGSMEARENAAATLFSLSVVDENKIMIGAAGAIAPLVTLLSEGTQRGKKDAATALFNLCIFQGNKGKAVRAGVVSILMQLLTEPEGSMVDEALAIMAILSSHPEGKIAIGASNAVPVLVEVIGNGSPRNKENAAAILVHLSSGDPSHLVEAQKLGVLGPLLDLSQNGTDRGKRKASQLLERMNRYAEQHNQQKILEVEDHQTSDTEQPPSTTVSVISN